MMRRTWIILVALLVVLLSLGLWRALHSERFILAVADWAVNQFTPLRLELRNPKIDLSGGRVSADEIHLIPKGTDGPALVSVLGFSGITTISDLLLANLAHTSLTADELVIYVSKSDESATPAPMEWLQYLTWLPQKLEIGAIHLVTAADRTLVFPLIGVQGKRLGDMRYRATARADYDGEPLEIEAQLRASRSEQLFTGIDISGHFLAPESDSDISLEGNLRGTENKFEYNFTVDGRYADVADFLRGFRTAGPLEGSLRVRGQLRGDNAGITLSDASIVLDNMPAYGFEAGGQLTYDFHGNSELNVIAAGEMSNLAYLLDWVGLDLTGLGKAQANLHLKGSLDLPYIEHFILSTHKDNGLTVNVAGSGYLPGMRPQGNEHTANEIQVDVLAPSLAVLEPWTGPISIDPGSWRASGKLIGDGESLAIDNLILETGSDDTVIVRAEGSVGNIVNVGKVGLAGITGIDAKLTGHTADTVHLAQLLHREIPPHHQLDASLQVAGEGDRLQVSDGRVDVKSQGLKLGVDIESALLRLLEEQKITGLIGGVQLQLDDSTVAERYLADVTLPALGPVVATADLVEEGSRFSLRNLQGNMTAGDLRVTAGGSIGDLVDLGGVKLSIDFEGVRIDEVLAYVLENFQYARPLGHLQGHFRLEDALGAWHISDILLDTTETDGPIELELTGGIRNLSRIPEANFNAKSQLRDPDLLEALLGLKMNPVSLTATASSQPGRLIVSSRSRVGDTQFSIGTEIEHDQNTINSFQFALATPHLYLEDLGLQATESEETLYKPAERVETEIGTELNKLLRTPPPFPFTLKLKVDGITGVNTDIEGVAIHLTGENGRYTLRDFTLDYADTQAELRGTIDLNPEPPAASFGIEAVAVPANALSRDLGVNTDVSGTLTVRGGLTAFGENLEAMKETLGGRVAVALKDAVIQGGAYDVLATDLLRWIYSAASLKTFTPVDCTMGLLEFDGGMIRTDSLFIETPEMVATGKGKLNMVKKTIDLTVTPLSKSRTIQVPSSVRIKGPLNDPTPIISPVTAVMDVSAEALTLIPRLTLKLFGIKLGPQRKSQPCEP